MEIRKGSSKIADKDQLGGVIFARFLDPSVVWDVWNLSIGFTHLKPYSVFRQCQYCIISCCLAFCNGGRDGFPVCFAGSHAKAYNRPNRRGCIGHLRPPEPAVHLFMPHWEYPPWHYSRRKCKPEVTLAVKLWGVLVFWWWWLCGDLLGWFVLVVVVGGFVVFLFWIVFCLFLQ